MEFAEALGRIAQNYGPGAAVVVAVAFVAFRVFFSKHFGNSKTEDPPMATRDDIDQLRKQLELSHQQLDSMRMQLARIDWLVQQLWLHGRCIGRRAMSEAEAGQGSQNV